MAIWVSVKRAAFFPAVLNFYHKAGAFLAKVKAARAAGDAWVRLPPSDTNVSWQDAQVDVTAIPGVAALKDNGHR